MLKVALLVVLVAAVWGAPSTKENSSDPGGRIVGGTNTTIENHPYIVSVQIDNVHVCGGTIISPIWIVSAAHCFSGSAPVSIRAGSTVRNSLGQVIPAIKILIHQGFSWFTLDYDVALIELASPIIHPVARVIGMTPEGNNPSAGIPATITGWGRLWEGGPMSEILQVVQVPIISQAACRAAYNQINVTDRMLCAGLLGVGGKDACQNDSGGPLVINGLLTGIVSWGDGCARPNSPGVYASVPALRAWIRQNSGI